MTSPSTPSAGVPAPAGAAASDAVSAGTAPAGSGSTLAPATSAVPPTTPPAAPIRLAADTAKTLQAALAAEQVAVWGYDIVAGYDPADADIITVIRTGHLARSQATAGLLVTGGSTAPSPAATYALPKPVTDVVSARALAATIEADCAAAWRGVIGATDNVTIRNIALAGLSDSAVWLTTLKMAAKASPVTIPFPGQS